MNFQNAAFESASGRVEQLPPSSVPEIVFSGRSNVGKSSLINSLLGRKSLARVSSSPGKTITVNFYEVDGKLFFVDLPGYGFAKRRAEEQAAWSALTDGYFTKNRNVDRIRPVVQLIDSRVGPTADDETMLHFLSESGLPYLVVATKCDKLNATERREAEARLSAHPLIPSGCPVIFYSALKGEGRTELWRQIAEATGIRP